MSAVVGYCRVSTVEQVTEGISLDAQAAAIRAHCAVRGLELVSILSDPAVSAATALSSRPAGRELLALVAGGQVKAVVAYRLDRLFRDAADCLSTVRQWDARGVALHMLDMGGQPLDTSSATGGFVLTILAAVAEMERALLRERIRLSNARLRSLGIYQASHTPRGYRREHRLIDGRERPCFVAVEAEAAIIRELYARRLAGETLAMLATWLGQVDGTAHSRASVRLLLLNPVYCGRVPAGRKHARELGVAAVNVEPLIPVKTWRACRRLRVSRSRPTPGG